MKNKKKAEQSTNPKITQLEDTRLKAQRALLQSDALDASAAMREPIVMHPADEVSEPPITGHSMLTQCISFAREPALPHLEGARDDLASVQHSPQKD